MGAIGLASVGRHPTLSGSIRVSFSETFIAADIVSGNFDIPTVVFSSASAVAGNISADLIVSGGLMVGTHYVLTASNVRDSATSTPITTPGNTFAFVFGQYSGEDTFSASGSGVDASFTGSLAITEHSFGGDSGFVNGGSGIDGAFTGSYALVGGSHLFSGDDGFDGSSTDSGVDGTPFTPQLGAPSFFPAAAGLQLELFWSQNLQDWGATSDPTRYTITGSVPVSVVSVDFTGSQSFLFLNTSPPIDGLPGGTYLISVLGGTALGVNGVLNQTQVSAFTVFECVIPSTPPTINDISPTPGANVFRFQPITFKVLDDSGNFRRIIVISSFTNATISGSMKECVHDGDDFSVRYSDPVNVRTPISGGFQFTILRDNGWPSNPTITPIAIDEYGNENV